jgi:hypothetical protein
MMQNLSAILETLQFCQDALSPLSHPVHKIRLRALVQLLQCDSAAEPTSPEITLAEYLYTLLVCHALVEGDAVKQEHISAVEQFLRERES